MFLVLLLLLQILKITKISVYVPMLESLLLHVKVSSQDDVGFFFVFFFHEDFYSTVPTCNHDSMVQISSVRIACCGYSQ